MLNILCNVDPPPPHTPFLYSKLKLGFTFRGILNFLIFAYRYLLELLLDTYLTVLRCTHNLCFEQKKKNIKIFYLKIIIFTAFENHSEPRHEKTGFLYMR